MRINAHGHILPYPEDIPQFMKDKKVFWVDADRSFMRQDDWSRPVTDPSFFTKEKLEWMDKNQIDHEVVLNLSQLYCNGLTRELCKDVLRFQNDFNASLQDLYPDKFTAGFVVQPAYIEDALKEIDRCVHELGLKVLCLPTHYLHSDGSWRSVADPSLHPIFEYANHLGLALEIHPYDGEKIIGLADQYWRFHLIWMCAQTADTYHMYTGLGFHDLYPKIRVCFAHGNQFGHIALGRRTQGYLGRPDLFPGASDPRSALHAKNIFVDTLVHDVFALRLILDRSGPEQILWGLDDPYPLGEMETVQDCYPGKLLDDAVHHQFLTKQQAADIQHKNVLTWLYGDSPQTLHDL